MKALTVKIYIGMLSIAFFSLQSCAKRFQTVKYLPPIEKLQAIDLTKFDVYSKHEYFNFDTFSRTDRRDLNNPLNERIGINYLLIDTTSKYPKNVYLLSPIKYYSKYNICILKNRKSDFSSFSRDHYENENIIDIRKFNLIRYGILLENGKIKFEETDFWKTRIDQINGIIQIDSVCLSNKKVVSIADNFQFEQIYRKIASPNWIFSDLQEDKRFELWPVKTMMWVKVHKDGNDIYFEREVPDKLNRYVRYIGRGR